MRARTKVLSASDAMGAVTDWVRWELPWVDRVWWGTPANERPAAVAELLTTVPAFADGPAARDPVVPVLVGVDHTAEVTVAHELTAEWGGWPAGDLLADVDALLTGSIASAVGPWSEPGAGGRLDVMRAGDSVSWNPVEGSFGYDIRAWPRDGVEADKRDRGRPEQWYSVELDPDTGGATLDSMAEHVRVRARSLAWLQVESVTWTVVEEAATMQAATFRVIVRARDDVRGFGTAD